MWLVRCSSPPRPAGLVGRRSLADVHGPQSRGQPGPQAVSQRGPRRRCRGRAARNARRPAAAGSRHARCQAARSSAPARQRAGARQGRPRAVGRGACERPAGRACPSARRHAVPPGDAVAALARVWHTRHGPTEHATHTYVALRGHLVGRVCRAGRYTCRVPAPPPPAPLLAGRAPCRGAQRALARAA